MADEKPAYKPDPRNVTGGPIRKGNSNPGAGKGTNLDSLNRTPNAPTTSSTPISDRLGKAKQSVDDELAVSSRKRAREVFDQVLNEDRWREIVQKAVDLAKAGNPTVLRDLMYAKMGTPVAQTVNVDKTPIKGADVRRAVEEIRQAGRAQLERDGIPTIHMDHEVSAGLWSAGADDEPYVPGQADDDGDGARGSEPQVLDA